MELASAPARELAQAFAAKANLRDVQPFAEGIEFNVYRATSPVHGDVVLRIPKYKIFQNANDPYNDARDLMRQEAALFDLLRETPVPVPQIYGYYEIDDYPGTVCEYLTDDKTLISDAEMGRVTAQIHSTPVPRDWPVKLVAMEGCTSDGVMDMLVKRILRRFGTLAAEEPGTKDWALDESLMREIAGPLGRHAPSLLHMDMRRVNLSSRGGKVAAVFDWTSVLLAPAALDVYRSLEWGELDKEQFRQGYESVRPLEPVSEREELFLRLDAALVLALVFVSEAPDAELKVGALRRVEELCNALRK